MARLSPLHALIESRPLVGQTHSPDAATRPGAAVGERTAHLEGNPEVEYLSIGEVDGEQREIVASYGSVEVEYAAIRRGAGLLDCPQRATLRVTGADRRDFLNRLLTQELKELGAGRAAESFWLNRQGRIEADLLLTETGDEILVDLDLNCTSAVVESLGQFVFTEEVVIEDGSESHYRLELHGGRATEILAGATTSGEIPDEPLRYNKLNIGGVEMVCVRRDSIGEPGFLLFVPRGGAEEAGKTLMAGGARLVGWYAYNTARIEAGTPLFNIDFGSSNLPHETGLLPRRVSFTKGCYLGQEIVARIESRGKPKQLLCGVRMQGDDLPGAGAVVYARTEEGTGEMIGIITSSTLSPMNGAVPVCLARLKTAHAESGTTVMVEGADGLTEGVVAARPFWQRENP